VIREVARERRFYRGWGRTSWPGSGLAVAGSRPGRAVERIADRGGGVRFRYGCPTRGAEGSPSTTEATNAGDPIGT
jgi:hypothetical protein